MEDSRNGRLAFCVTNEDDSHQGIPGLELEGTMNSLSRNFVLRALQRQGIELPNDAHREASVREGNLQHLTGNLQGLALLESMPGILQVHGLLGEGKFSKVYGCLVSVNGEPKKCAVKVLRSQLEASHEIQLHTKLEHPKLVKLLHVIDAGPALIMELCEGGDLWMLLHGLQTKEAFKDVGLQARIGAAIDVGQALIYLHSMRVVHRDVKTGNCFLNTLFVPGALSLPTVKLGDLGLARYKMSREANMTKCVGTIRYMAPEVLNSNCYDQAVDVFSYGIVLYELISGQVPYGRPEQNDARLMNEMVQQLSACCVA